MSEALRTLGPSFERVAIKVESGRPLRLAGILRAHIGLEEVPVFPEPIASRRERRGRTVRAFRVHGDAFHSDGLRDGDCLLIEAPVTPRSGSLVLVEKCGRRFLRRTSGETSSVHGSRIIGAFVGIICKRGFWQEDVSSGPSRGTPARSDSCRPVPRLGVLRSKLCMLESTWAVTKNPRLQRALRNEAERVRRQLQNEADID